MIEEPTIQNTPIISDGEINRLKAIEFEIVKNKDKEPYKQKFNLYTANDHDFMWFFAKITKTKKEKLLDGVLNDEGWTNVNRLRIRLDFLKRFEKSISGYQKELLTNK